MSIQTSEFVASLSRSALAVPTAAAVARLREVDAREEKIQREIELGFQGCPYREIRKLSCRYDDGLAVVEGRVSSFHLKQIAQTILKHIDGVRDILNSVEVQPPKARQAR